MKKLRLGLFFTRAISLDIWEKKGLLDREKLIYEQHLEDNNLERVYWFTYGHNDEDIAQRLKNEKKLNAKIIVKQMPRIFPRNPVGILLYSFLLPFFHLNILGKIDFYKSNQMDGSWAALISKMLFHKPLVLRTGFTLSLFLRKKSKVKAFIIGLVERFMYYNSDLSYVSSHADKEYICNNYGISKNSIKVLHNYIDTNLFNDRSEKREDAYVFVGRLNHQKNLYSLLNAFDDTGLSLVIYGDGEELEDLKKYKDNKLIEFKGRISNDEVANILNKYKFYILPSFYEGMPKTLLEGMASGCICLGTPVVGINEVIQDEFNGLLSKSVSAEDLKRLVVKSRTFDTANLIKNSRLTISQKFSLKGISHLEASYWSKL